MSPRFLMLLMLVGCPASENVGAATGIADSVDMDDPPVPVPATPPASPEQVRTTVQENVSIQQEQQLDQMIRDLTNLHHKLHKLKKAAKNVIAPMPVAVSEPDMSEPDPTIISAPPVSVGVGTPMGEDITGGSTPVPEEDISTTDITYTGSGTQTDSYGSEYPVGGY